MNDTQTVFMVFLAIFWGVSGNVQGRWKAFHHACPLARTKNRYWMSLGMLNLIPLGYFLLVIWLLHGEAGKAKVWDLSSTGGLTLVKLTFCGIVPAFAAFGFYRLWLAKVENHPTKYYYEFPEELCDDPSKDDWRKYANSEPTIERLYYPRTDIPDESAVRKILPDNEKKALEAAQATSPPTPAKGWTFDERYRRYFWSARRNFWFAIGYFVVALFPAVTFRIIVYYLGR